MIPSILGDLLLGLFFSIPIATHHGIAPDDDLALLTSGHHSALFVDYGGLQNYDHDFFSYARFINFPLSIMH